MRFNNTLSVSITLFTVLLLSSCLTPKKMDLFISDQYNDQIPKLNKKTIPDVNVTSIIPSEKEAISSTVKKTSKVLPLIVYWQYDYRHTSTLNPTIPFNNFTNTFNKIAAKDLSQKLNGKKLQLTVEQLPTTFALVDKGHIIWVVYAFSWNKLYMEPDRKDLVVSYQLLENEKSVKTGKITINSSTNNKGIRFFQSWKSATSEYLTEYNSDITNMTKSFVNQLMEEL